MTIDELKFQLKRFNIKPSKRLGQNFLLSEEILDQIVSSADLKPTDTVLEIGPGLGVLSRRLGERAGLVLAVEKDRKLVEALRKLFKSKKNIKVIQGDALFFNPVEHQLQSGKYKLIANIPYYITGKLLRNFLTGENKPELIVLMIQKEVAERIVARPGQMSLLSVSARFYSDAKIVAEVGRKNFFPSPAVDSAVIKLEVLKKPRLEVDEKKFFQLVKVGFANKRKMLVNNLSAVFKKTNKEIQEKLQATGINPKARAQDLSLEDWRKLYESIF